MEPYWPWWAVLTFFGSGAFCAWVWTIGRRPSRVDCPHCEEPVRVARFRDHWKACLS